MVEGSQGVWGEPGHLQQPPLRLLHGAAGDDDPYALSALGRRLPGHAREPVDQVGPGVRIGELVRAVDEHQPPAGRGQEVRDGLVEPDGLLAAVVVRQGAGQGVFDAVRVGGERRSGGPEGDDGRPVRVGPAQERIRHVPGQPGQQGRFAAAGACFQEEVTDRIVGQEGVQVPASGRRPRVPAVLVAAGVAVAIAARADVDVLPYVDHRQRQQGARPLVQDVGPVFAQRALPLQQGPQTRRQRGHDGLMRTAFRLRGVHEVVDIPTGRALVRGHAGPLAPQADQGPDGVGVRMDRGNGLGRIVGQPAAEAPAVQVHGLGPRAQRLGRLATRVRQAVGPTHRPGPPLQRAQLGMERRGLLSHPPRSGAPRVPDGARGGHHRAVVDLSWSRAARGSVIAVPVT